MKIYCDLDGVLVNWDAGVRKLGKEAAEGLLDNATEEQKTKMFTAVNKAGRSFWENLEWQEDGKILWDYIKKFFPVLLSSPGSLRGAPAGKQDWVSKNLPGVSLFTETEKYKYAEKDAILIDDMEKNIGPWKEAGGIGILHKNSNTTIQELKELMKVNKLSCRIPISDFLRFHMY